MELKHINADGAYKKEIINEEKKVCNKSVTNQIFGGSTGLLKNYSWKNLNGRNVHAFVVALIVVVVPIYFLVWYNREQKIRITSKVMRIFFNLKSLILPEKRLNFILFLKNI